MLFWGALFMLKRKIEENMDAWLRGNKSLLVEGARQVGKTFLIREFCKKNFENYFEINLLERKDAVNALSKVNNAKDLLLVLSSFSDVSFVPGKTVIFIDEIQEAKELDVVTMSKFLVEEGSYRFIFSGSLLGVELDNTKSWPVGYMEIIKMFPLDFEEFLWANKVNDDVIREARNSFFERRRVLEPIHDKLLDYYYKYLIVGGMPEAVNEFVNSNDLKRVSHVQNMINTMYKKDVGKYSKLQEKLHLEQVYNLIPEELNSKSKRFSLGKIGSVYQTRKITDDFVWLTNAGVGIPVYNVSEPVVPLVISVNRRLLKLFLSDVGILTNCLMDTEIRTKLLSREKSINYGAVFENACAQELLCHGFEEIFYYNSKKNGEVDFLITYKGKVVPLEIKSGKDYEKHSALTNLLSNENYEIDEAFVFCNDNYKISGKIHYFPVYMLSFLERNR